MSSLKIPLKLRNRFLENPPHVDGIYKEVFGDVPRFVSLHIG